MRLGQNVGHGSDVGRVRPLNEDYHRVLQFPLRGGPLTLLAVADGMGGAAAGEVASKLAMEVLDESFSRYVSELELGKTMVSIERLTEKAIRLANRKVYAEATKDSGRKGMGTTLTLAAIQDNSAILGHVGDSRAYLVRDERIYQLTKDHSWVEEQRQRGLLTDAEAQTHEWRNLITRALGTRPEVEPDIIPLTVRPGDVLALCSDGLHGQVEAPEILAEIGRTSNRQSSVEYLIGLANQRGGPDNITLVIAEIP